LSNGNRATWKSARSTSLTSDAGFNPTVLARYLFYSVGGQLRLMMALSENRLSVATYLASAADSLICGLSSIYAIISGAR